MPPTIWVILACLGAQAAATHVVQHETVSTCSAPTSTLLSRSLSQDVLYNIAYEWGHQQKIRDWKYSHLGRAESALLPITRENRQLSLDDGRQCVQVSYSVAVKLPGYVPGFASRYSDPVPLSKTVCTSTNKIFEHTILSGLPVVGTIEVSTESVLNGGMRTVSSTDAHIPMMLFLFTDRIKKSIQKSWTMKNKIMAEQLCA